ncbi:MAG: ATP synthase subunit I [Clostridiaceae bacterium]
MSVTGENYQLWIIKRTLSVALILSALILITFSNPKEYIYGLLFSTCITVLNFRLMCISIEKSLYMAQKKIKFFILTNYTIRTFIYGVVIFISYIADYLNFYTAILGLFSVKIIIIFSTFYKNSLFKIIKK